YPAASFPVLSVRARAADRASCPEFLPDERIATCRLARTISRCCIHDQSHPSCIARVECQDSRVAVSTNGPGHLRKCRGSERRRGNASCKACLLQYCLETNSAAHDLCCRASSLVGRDLFLSAKAVSTSRRYRVSLQPWWKILIPRPGAQLKAHLPGS